MGQMTFGILYGIDGASSLSLREEDWGKPFEEHAGLLDRWERECAAKIDALEAKTAAKRASQGGPWWDYACASECYIPDWPEGESDHLLGFWVALGASGKAGVPDMETVAVGAIRSTEPYATAYRHARRRWRRFARWAAAQGVELPKARLWIAETEVA